MHGFNFCEKWCTWIKGCIELASTSVLVNAGPSGDFPLGHGLRQEDPLSHFLFLLAAEGLSLLVSLALANNFLNAAEIGKDKIVLPYLQYADNSVFICNRGIDNIISIKRILRLFELMSGLKVNFHKCKIVQCLPP